MERRDPRPDVAAWEKAVLVTLCAAVVTALALLTGGALAGLITGGGWAPARPTRPPSRPGCRMPWRSGRSPGCCSW